MSELHYRLSTRLAFTQAAAERSALPSSPLPPRRHLYSYSYSVHPFRYVWRYGAIIKLTNSRNEVGWCHVLLAFLSIQPECLKTAGAQQKQ